MSGGSRRTRAHLEHIVDAIDAIDDFTRDGRDRFSADRMLRDAVLRNLHTLSESTQQLPDEFKLRRPDIDWRGAAAFRNVVVHDYVGIDYDMVWIVVERVLPRLREAVVSLLAALS